MEQKFKEMVNVMNPEERDEWLKNRFLDISCLLPKPNILTFNLDSFEEARSSCYSKHHQIYYH